MDPTLFLTVRAGSRWDRCATREARRAVWQQSSEQNGTRGRSDHIRVGGFDLVEKRLDITRRAESERDACAASESDHQEDIESYNAHDAGTRRANRHADTDLAAALEDGVVEDGVEPNAGEEQRDGGKEGGEHGNQALANRLVADQIQLGGDIGDAKSVMALSNQQAEGVGECERVLSVGVNDESGEVDDTRGGLVVDLGKGT